MYIQQHRTGCAHLCRYNDRHAIPTGYAATVHTTLATHILDRKTYHRKSMHVEEMSGDTRCVREVYWLFSNPEENTREEAKQPKHKRHPPQTNPETKTSQ